MLKRLKVENLALIEIIEINFEKGLNVFTGESGSGKSLILDSLNTLFGGTNIALNHLIRPGETECLIEAIFEVSTHVSNFLFENDINIIDNQLIIQRNSLKKGSRIISKYKLNNKSVKKNFLQKLGYFLIDFSGQNDKYLFNSQDYLRHIVDDFGSQELEELNIQIKQTFFKLKKYRQEISSKLLEMKKNKDNYSSNINLLNILEDAELADQDEIKILKSKQLKLSHNYELKSVLNAVLSNLTDFDSGDKSASSLIYDSIKQLNKIIKYDEIINNFSDKLISLQSEIENVIHLIIQYLENSEKTEDKLENVQARLYKLQNLEKSFSLNLDKLIDKRNELRKLQSLADNHEEIKNLQSDYTSLNNIFIKNLEQQTAIRKRIAFRLEKSVTNTLIELGLVNAKFLIELIKCEPDSTGANLFQFLFSANPDQKPALISDIISGGEMSRFFLALKFHIADEQSSLFFDEIDNGLSGKSLLSTINLVKKISAKQQTLCITHHPLLAAYADVHYKVKKNIINGYTTTSLVRLVTNKQKQNELAELIGGGFEEANSYALTLMNKVAA